MLQLLVLVFSIATVLPEANAGIIVEKSRIIFPMESLSKPLKILNSNNYPVICKVWVGKGYLADIEQPPIIVKKPFFKLNPHEESLLTFINIESNNSLLVDREHLYWLNIEEIPPRDKDYLHNDIIVSLVMNTQLKIFYRPENLPITPNEGYKKQSFELHVKDNTTFIRIDNNSPYYVTYSDITIQDKSGEKRILYPGMIPPYSDEEIEVSENMARNDEIIYTVISDGGFPLKYRTSIIKQHF